MTIKEIWSLLEDGRTLSIQRTISSFMGEQNLTLIFNRR